MTPLGRGALEAAMLIGLLALLFDTYWLTAACLAFIGFVAFQLRFS